MELEQNIIVQNTFHRHKMAFSHVANLPMPTLRIIFHLIRTSKDQANPDIFFPHFGITSGEFSVGRVIHKSGFQFNQSPHSSDPDVNSDDDNEDDD